MVVERKQVWLIATERRPVTETEALTSARAPNLQFSPHLAVPVADSVASSAEDRIPSVLSETLLLLCAV